MRRQVVRLLVLSFSLLLLVACEQEQPPTQEVEMTPEATATLPPATEAVAAEATSTPTPVPLPTEAVSTPTPEATATPAPTTPPLPTATPFPLVRVLVRDAESEQPLSGAEVVLGNDAEYQASFRTGASGAASFAGVEPGMVYTLTTTASGYTAQTLALTAEAKVVETTVDLAPGVTGTTTVLTNMREQPGFGTELMMQLEEGTVVTIVAASQSEEWLQIQTNEGQVGWVFADLLELSGDLADLSNPVATSAPTATPSPESTPGITPTATMTGTVAAPTPTPGATGTAVAGGLPPRPAPVPFTASAFVESMDDLRVLLETMGGILDQTATDDVDCEAYSLYYGQVNAIPTYNQIPEEWQGYYDFYITVADNILTTNESLYQWCQEGGEDLSVFNRNVARSAILNNLFQLIPALEQAEELLAE